MKDSLPYTTLLIMEHSDRVRLQWIEEDIKYEDQKIAWLKEQREKILKKYKKEN